MSRALLLAALALTLSVPAAEPAARPVRFLLAVAGGGIAALYVSSDSVHFTPAPGFSPAPGTSPTPVRRGSTLYLFDSPSQTAGVLGGTLRRFTVASGRLTEQAPASYQVQLASPEDAQRATAGSFVPSFAVDDSGGLTLLYELRFEPGTNACPLVGRSTAGQSPPVRQGVFRVSRSAAGRSPAARQGNFGGQSCVKLRTATEVAGSDGTAFTGDPGNRIVLGFDPTDSIGPPALLRGDRGWAVLLQGPAGCLHVLTAPDPHKAYRNAGCISAQGPASPAGLWDARLREYRLFGVTGGHVVRAVSAKLARVAPARFRPLTALGGRPAAVRIAANAP